jgi:hypothetical protein
MKIARYILSASLLLGTVGIASAQAVITTAPPASRSNKGMHPVCPKWLADGNTSTRHLGIG